MNKLDLVYAAVTTLCDIVAGTVKTLDIEVVDTDGKLSVLHFRLVRIRDSFFALSPALGVVNCSWDLSISIASIHDRTDFKSFMENNIKHECVAELDERILPAIYQECTLAIANSERYTVSAAQRLNEQNHKDN